MQFVTFLVKRVVHHAIRSWTKDRLVKQVSSDFDKLGEVHNQHDVVIGLQAKQLQFFFVDSHKTNLDEVPSPPKKTKP